MTKSSLGSNDPKPEEIVFSLQKVETLCNTATEDAEDASKDPSNLGYPPVTWVDPNLPYTGPTPPPALMAPLDYTQHDNSFSQLAEDCVFFVCNEGKCEDRPKYIRWWYPFIGFLIADTLQRVIYAYQTFEDCAKACGCECPVEGTQKYVVSTATPPCDCCGPDSYAANEGGNFVCKCSDSKPGYTLYQLPWSSDDKSGSESICCHPTMEGTISTDPLKIECKCKNPGDTRSDLEAGSVCCGQAIMGTTGATVQLQAGTTQQSVNGSMRTIPECQCPQGGAYGNTTLYKTEGTGTSICCPEGFTGQDVSGLAKCVSKWYCDGSGGCQAQQPGQQIVINGQTLVVGEANGELIAWDTEAECKAAGCGGQYCAGEGAEAQCANVTWEHFVRGNPLNNVKMMSASECSTKCGKFVCNNLDWRYPGCFRLDQSVTGDYHPIFWENQTLYESREACQAYCEVRWACGSGEGDSYECTSVPAVGSFGAYSTPEDCCSNCEKCSQTNCGGAGQSPCCPQGYTWDGQRCSPQ